MKRPPLLFLNVLIVATCGLIYELLAGTLASYVLGDSVTQFSLIIGIYLFAMGVGSWLSRFIDKGLARRFVDIELAVAILGGFSAPLLFITFSRVSYFYARTLFCRLRDRRLCRTRNTAAAAHPERRDRIQRACLARACLRLHRRVARLDPISDSVRSAAGIDSNVADLWNAECRRRAVGHVAAAAADQRQHRWAACEGNVVMALLLIGLVKANTITSLAEDEMFADEIVYTKDTPYQRIVITRGRAGFQLFLNGNLQFSSTDEYRYHEALVHPAMLLANNPRRVLVLGGGDGLALREVLKYPSVERVTFVDLDPEMTRLSSRFPSARAVEPAGI